MNWARRESRPARFRLIARLTRRLVAAFVRNVLRLTLLRLTLLRLVRQVVARTAMVAAPAVHAVAVLTAIELIVAVRAVTGILARILSKSLVWILRLRLAAAGNERRQTADIATLWIGRLRDRRLMLRLMLRLVLRAGALLVLGRILRLLVLARLERLGVARQIGLRLFAWRVRLVLAGLRLVDRVIALVEIVIGALWRAALLLLLIVVWVLLAELLLRRRDQTKIMFGVLIVVLGSDRIARTLRVAGELNVFFRDVRRRSADLHIGAVRLV